jgi:hypothetical protein
VSGSNCMSNCLPNHPPKAQEGFLGYHSAATTFQVFRPDPVGAPNGCLPPEGCRYFPPEGLIPPVGLIPHGVPTPTRRANPSSTHLLIHSLTNFPRNFQPCNLRPSLSLLLQFSISRITGLLLLNNSIIKA